MADPPDAGRLETIARRIDFLERLQEGPAYKRDLVDELPHSRSTVDRALDELADATLVERREDGYAATTAGRLAAERYRTFQRELDDVADAQPVLEPVPADAAVGVEFVAGSEAAVASGPAPYRPLEQFHDAVAAADRYRGCLPALDDPRHVRLLYEHAVTSDRSVELVVAPALFDALREEFPRRMAAMAESGRFDVRVGEVPPYGLVLLKGEAGSTAWAVVFDDRGTVHGVLENDTDGGIRWAEDRCRAVRSAAADRTDRLLADADGGVDAGTDGGAVLPPIGESLSVGLEREGFVRLDRAYFRNEPVADPTTAWRAGLTLPEVNAGYAVPRAPPADAPDDAEEMADLLRSKLLAGGACAVVGPPGAGKSTICKRVAGEWYAADRGPVLYREGDRGRAFESVADLAVTLDAADGHALVVVEDAVRPDADAAFDAVDRFGDRDDVSFLLDARESEWRDPPGELSATASVDVVHVPGLRAQERRRIVERFEETTGESVEVPLDRLWTDVREVAGGGAVPDEMLLLLHRLAAHADPLAADATSLEAAVGAVHDDLAGDDLALDVCVLANALNAAGLAVDPGALYAPAAPGEYDAVDDAIDRLMGRVLFPRDDGDYRTVHETWSVAFLAHLLDAEGERAAADRFGGAVSALLSLADDPDRRAAITAHSGREPLPDAAADPGRWADETAETVHALGRERPKLAPLFGGGERDAVELPDACSASVVAERPAWLGRLFAAGGYYDRAERAFERLPAASAAGDADVTDESGDGPIERLLGLSRIAAERGDYGAAADRARECLTLVGDADRPVVRGRARLRLGGAESGRGDYETAESHYGTALSAFEAAGDRRRAARVLNNLGGDAYRQRDYERARKRLAESIAIKRELGDRQGEAKTYNNLGLIARERGRYDRARRHHERSLALARAVGDRRELAHILGNLGIVSTLQGDHDGARERFERSLEIKRDLGDRRGVGNSLGNLGKIAQTRGEYDEAREYCRRSLDVWRDLENRHGEGISLRNLGEIALLQGRYDRAAERFDEGLSASRAVGDRQGEANCLRNLGRVALARGHGDDAGDRFRQALSIAEEIDHFREATTGLRGLGELARRRGEYDEAAAHLDRASDRAESVDDPAIAGRVSLSRARLALDRGDLPAARDRAQRAREAFAGADSSHREARCRRLLGRIAARSGDSEAAREHWRGALETFEAVGAPQDALPTLRHLFESHRDAGDGERAGSLCDRAADLLAAAPDAAVEDHREWIDRCLDDAPED
ncbi:MAG: tetratricopeptide repeat protein [Halobacteriales archaeon]